MPIKFTLLYLLIITVRLLDLIKGFIFKIVQYVCTYGDFESNVFEKSHGWILIVAYLLLICAFIKL